jgi:hypothetical protein
MAYRTRINYTAEQKAEMWDRWQRGQSLHSIARLFDRYHTSVRGIIAATGGVRPYERRRSYRVLTLAEGNTSPAVLRPVIPSGRLQRH